MFVCEKVLALARDISSACVNKGQAEQYAWLLLQKVCGLSKEQLLLQKQLELDAEQKELLKALVFELVYEHKPMAYILESVSFGGFDLVIWPPVLIPRSETEYWAHLVIDYYKQQGIVPCAVLDMCTGSGCLAILFAHAFTQAVVVGIDNDPAALMLAQENKQRLRLENVHLVQSNLFEQLSADERFDVIVANPPYLAEIEKKDLDPGVAHWESEHALVSGPTGFECIEAIIVGSRRFLRRSDSLTNLWVEIGWQQAEHVVAFFEHAGFVDVRVIQDQYQRNRVVAGRYG